MKRFGGWVGIAVAAFGLVGCDDGSSKTPPQAVVPGGPGSFEEDQKKQGEMMLKSAKSSKGVPAPTAPAEPAK